MQKLIISPSILSLDYANTSEQLQQLNNSEAEWLHFDVMDGHFVPNLTFGPDILRGFKKCSSMFMDVHIMVEDPYKISELFVQAGADLITFHVEALDSIEECITLCRRLRAAGVQAGVSVKPKTEIDILLPYLHEMDLVLVMSVEPGFGGQSFMGEMLNKVKRLRKEIEDKNLATRIEIDGGINAKTAKQAIEAGCDTLVAGSYIFKENIQESVHTLLCLKQS